MVSTGSSPKHHPGRAEFDLRTLNAFAISLLRQNDVDDLCWSIAENIGTLLDQEDCVVYLREGETLIQVAAYGAKNPEARDISHNITIPLGEGIVGTVAQTGVAEIVSDTQKDPRYIHDEFSGRSELAVPILYEGEVLGVLDTESSVVGHYRDADLKTLQSIANLASSRIASAIAEQHRHRAENRYHTLVETIPHGIEDIDTAGNITFANQAQHAMYEFPPEALVGRSILDFVATDADREELRDYLQYLVKEQPEPTGYVGKKVTKTGRFIDVHVAWNYRRDELGQVVGFTSIITDVTERERAEEKLKEAHARLEQRVNERTQELERAHAEHRDLEQELRRLQAQLAHVARAEAMGELAGALAHELSQPLAANLTFCQASQRFLERPVADLDEVGVGLSAAIEQGLRAKGVIQRISNLLQKRQVRKEELDINDVIRQILPLVNSDALDRGIVLELDLAENLPPVEGDAVYLQQVVMNLLLNAFFAVESDTDGKNEVLLRTLFDREGNVSVVVSDTGTGFEAGDEAQLFEPFFTTKSEGLGIGLAVSRTIVEEHGGRLEANRNPDEGATFHFTLPVDEKLQPIPS